MNILITGASGFVGRATAEALVHEGHQVIGTTTSPPVPAAAGIQWIHWDATTSRTPAVDWDGIQAVLHLAAPHDLFAFPAQAQSMFDTTVSATFHLLQQAALHPGVTRVVIASTGNVLGPGEGPAREDDTCYQPGSFYGAAKACAELFSRAYQGLVSTAVLRFYHPYGPGGDRFLINRVLDNVIHGRELRIEGEDGILLNPVWIDDLVDGIRLALNSRQTGIFHLGGPDTLTFRQMAELMGKLAGRSPVIRVLPPKGGEPHFCDYTRSSTQLGYCPRIEMHSGLEQLMQLRGKS